MSLGAVAWVPLIGTTLTQISLSGGAHVLLTGPAIHTNVTTITDDGTSKLYVISSIKLQDQLSPCTKVFKEGRVVISGGRSKATIERDVDVFGRIEFVDVPNVYIGHHGGALTVHSGTSPTTIQLENLVVEAKGGFFLLNYNPPSPAKCAWNLQLKAMLSLGNQARFRVDCAFNSSGSQLVVGTGAEFSLKNITQESKMAFNRLDITGRVQISGIATTKFFARTALISGTFTASNLSTATGWTSLVILRTGKFEIDHVGWFGVDHFVINGTFISTNAINMKGCSQQNIPEIIVSQGGVFEILSRNPDDILCDRKVFSESDLSKSETSQIYTNKITIGGSWMSNKLRINSGLHTFTLHESGKFQFEPVGWFSVDYFVIKGQFKALNSIKMKGLSKPKISYMTIGTYSKVNVQTKMSSLVCTGSGLLSTQGLIVNGTSIVQAEQVTIGGVFQISKMQIQPGWESMNIESSGSFQFDPVDWYQFDNIIINGSMRSVDTIKIKGLSTGKVKNVLIGRYGTVKLESKIPDKAFCDNKLFQEADIFAKGVVMLRADNVTVLGTLISNMLSISPGWAKLNVSRTGLFQFKPVDWFSFDEFHVYGTFKVLRSIKMRGLAQQRISSFTVGSHGSITVSTDPNLVLCNADTSVHDIIVNETSILQAGTVSISGHVSFQKLTTVPGWGRFSLQRSSSFQANPVGWFQFNTVIIDGIFKLLNSVKMKGTNQEKITTISVGQYGTVNIQSQAPDRIICDHANISSVNFISSGISLVKSSYVTIAGAWLTNKLAIYPGWNSLIIQKTGTFGAHPVNWFSFDNLKVDGNFHAVDVIKMKGVLRPKIASVYVGKTGRINIDTKASTVSSCTATGSLPSPDVIVNGISMLRANKVEIAGSIVVKKLTIVPGWGDFILHDWASFQFDPVKTFTFDTVVVHGSFKSLNAIQIEGTSQSKVNTIHIGKNGTIQILQQAPDIDLCDRLNFSSLDFVKHGISSVKASQVNIEGSWLSKKLSINPGWSSIAIQKSGKFEFDPIDWFSTDSLQIDGIFHSLNAIKMKGLTKRKISHIVVNEIGSITVDSKTSTATSCTGAGQPSTDGLIVKGISIIRADTVIVGGQLTLQKLSILPGWENLNILKSGTFQFNPVNWYSFDRISIAGNLRSLNSIRIKGCSQEKVLSINVASGGIVNIASKPPYKLICDRLNFSNVQLIENGISLIQAHNVSIGGSWTSKKLALRPGWESLTIQETGTFELEPVDWYSFDSLIVNGRMTVRDSIKINGISSLKTKNINVGIKGIVYIETKSNSASKCLGNSQNTSVITSGVSIVKADIVTVAGIWTMKKLTIKPGWTSLSVAVTGRMEVDPYDWYNVDRIVIDGHFIALSNINIKGLSKAKTYSISVGSRGYVSVLSKHLTTILCDRVTVYGLVQIGLLSIRSGWQYLGVLGSNGNFIFNSNDPMPIISTQVSGLVKTTSPLGPLDPITGHQFVVETSGHVFINYQGPSTGYGKGALNTSIFMTGAFKIDGTFETGSLYVDALDIIVGPTGRIDVNAGGCQGASGPGAGISSSTGASGASNGGRGGRGSGTQAHHLPYGNIFTVGEWGSGGGHGSSGGGGGRGGGMIQFHVNNSLVVNGEIQMNGQNAQVRYKYL